MGDEQLHDIRDTLNHELVLGRLYFIDKIETLISRQARMGEPGRLKVEEARAIYPVGI